MISRCTLLPALIASAALLSSTAGHTQSIYVGGLDTLFMEADPVAGTFVPLGACGGSIQSMVESYQDLYIGDVGGRVYIHYANPTHPNAGLTTYLFDSPNDATALVDYGGALLVGGSDGSVLMIDKRDGSVEATYSVQFPIGALALDGDTLYFGSPNKVVGKIDLVLGGTAIIGACGGPVQSMVIDGDHLILGTPNQLIYRMRTDTGLLDAFFPVTNNATSLLLHTGDLLVGGSDSSILRVNKDDGTLISTLSSPGQDVSAMAISPLVQEPGLPYCFGIDCPCGNPDPLAGCANTQGKGARMHASGSSSFLADDLVITVDGLPSGAWSIIYMGALTNEVPFGDGLLCAGAGYPLFRFPIQQTGASGSLSIGPGIADYSLNNFPALGQISPSSTWLWQIWYRNPQGPCGSGFNTSNGYKVAFTQ